MKHKQNVPVYLIIDIGNLDKTVDFEDVSPRTYDNPHEALEAAKDDVDEYGMITYVYECIPVYRVSRGKIRVKQLKLGGVG